MGSKEIVPFASKVCLVWASSHWGTLFGSAFNGSIFQAAFGHLKLRTLLTKHALAVNEEWPVVGQFSSIGSLGSTAEAWLTGEFLESLSSPAAVLARRPHLNLVSVVRSTG